MAKVNKMISISTELSVVLDSRKDLNVSEICEKALWDFVNQKKKVLSKEVEGNSLNDLLPEYRKRFFSEAALNDFSVKRKIVDDLCVRFGLSRAKTLELLQD